MPNLYKIAGSVAEILESDQWTLDKLAEASVSNLIKYEGIGKVGAKRLIDKAKEELEKFNAILTEEQGWDHEMFVRTGINPNLAKWFVLDGYTLSNLMEASPEELLQYTEIKTQVDAFEIILKAEKQMYSKTEENDSKPLEINLEEELPPASARVQRIRNSLT